MGNTSQPIKYLVFATLVFSFLIVGCHKGLKPDFKPTEEEFSKAVGSFPYTAPDERKLKVLGNYSKLQLGMTKDQIAEFIGEPDYSVRIGGKSEEETRGSAWVYAFYCTGRFCGTTSADDLVEIFFDLDDQVTWIASSERLGLNSKKLPTQ